MTGSLASFQSDLARALQGEDTCPLDANSAGYRLTLKVRRSWCEGRVIVGSRQILRAIPEADRQRLVSEYVDRGGGLEMFLHREAEAFLRFLAPQLPDPSHALTLCQIYLAVTRAQRGAALAAEPQQIRATGMVKRGRYASLVWFYADPDEVIAGLAGEHLPPVGAPKHAVLFAPRLPDFFRVATEAEAGLWAALPTDLVPDALIAPLLRDGVIEYSDRDDPSRAQVSLAAPS
jgi:hypothetical protein